MRNIKNYIWFIKESQNFMSGNKLIIFLLSLYKGIGFCKQMRYDNKMFKKYGELYYANMNRVIEIDI